MEVEFYRRVSPKLGIVRLVSGKHRKSDPQYVGWRVNLLFWAVEYVHSPRSGA